SRAGNAHINASGRFDVLEASTGFGHIHATALANSTVSSAWTLQAGKGNVTLHVPESLVADVSLHSSHGRVTLGLPVELAGNKPHKKPGRKDVDGKLNGGGKMLTMNAGHGSVSVEKL